MRRLSALAALLFACGSMRAQQPIDSAYTARIRELTPTDPNWKAGGARVTVADTAFGVGAERFPAGRFILSGAGGATADTVRTLGLTAVAVSQAPAGLKVPRPSEHSLSGEGCSSSKGRAAACRSIWDSPPP